jgi:hypothetical protein
VYLCVSQVAAKEETLRQCQHEAEETTHKLQMEKESIVKAMQALEAEKEAMIAKQASSNELVSPTFLSVIML